MPRNFVFDPGRKFRLVVRGWARSLSNLTWAWTAVGREVAKVHNTLFDSEGASGRNGRWTDLAEATKRFRERGVGYYGRNVGMASARGPILHWTWRLRDSLSDFHPRGTMWSIRKGFRNRFTFGTAHPAADELHRGSLGLPARELLDEEGALRATIKLLRKVVPNQMRTAPRGRFRNLR